MRQQGFRRMVPFKAGVSKRSDDEQARSASMYALQLQNASQFRGSYRMSVPDADVERPRGVACSRMM